MCAMHGDAWLAVKTHLLWNAQSGDACQDKPAKRSKGHSGRKQMAKKKGTDEFGTSIDDIFGNGGIADILSDIGDDADGGWTPTEGDAAPDALGDGTGDGTSGDGEAPSGQRYELPWDEPDATPGDESGDEQGATAGDARADGDASARQADDAGGGRADDDGLSIDDLIAADQSAGEMASAEAAAREEPEPALSKSAKRRRNKKRKQEELARQAAEAAGDTGNAQGDAPGDAGTGSGSRGGEAAGEASGGIAGVGVPDGMEEIRLPQWALSIAAKRSAGVAHAFMLSGNVRDYMVRKVSVRDGLIGMLDPKQDAFEVIATYDQASGLQFDLGDRYDAVSSDEYRRRYVSLMHAARKARGTGDDPDDDTIPTDPCELFEDIGTIFDMDADDGKARMLLFVDFLDMLCPNGATLQLSDRDKRLAITIADMCRSYKADAEGSCVFFLTDAAGQVNSTVRDTSNRIDQVMIPQPLTDDRRDFIDNVLDVPGNVLSDGRHVLHCEDGVDPEYLTASTAGLARYQIEDIVLRCVADDVPVTAQGIKERKNEIIQNDYHGVLEIMDPKYGFDSLGGMETQKRFFKEEVIDPIKKGQLEAIPMGILLSGSPGNGKTVLAKAVAKESGMNCVALNMNSLFSDDSGHAERNLDRALDCAMAMAPTIVFIDEIDEALPKRHTGTVSSISNHINKTMLTFLSDTSHRGKVIFLAATNFPEQIDPAMKRAGRFDKRIPIFAPTGYDRVRIIKISCRKATDANVNGDTVPYEMSCLRSPDEMVPNPFDVRTWLANGGRFDASYAGDRVQYEYSITDKYGDQQGCLVELPQVLYDVIGKRRITLQAMYRAFFAVFALPERGHDNTTNAVEGDQSYYERIDKMIHGEPLLFRGDEKVMSFVSRYIRYYDRIYSQFMAQTDHMTGAELDVVVQKAITLFRKWCEEHDDLHREMLHPTKPGDGGKPRKPSLRSEKDIPWAIVYEACMKTASSTAGVKSMEDNALLDTSDLDFIPDAIYGKRNRELITYKQRLSELRNQQL